DANERAKKSQPRSARNKPEPPQPKLKQEPKGPAQPAEAKNTSATGDRSADSALASLPAQVSSAQPTNAPPPGGKLPLVTGIRHWSTPDYTRVAIDLEQEVSYEAGRVPNPDRIFFDLHNTKLASGLTGKEFEVEDGLLHKIR